MKVITITSDNVLDATESLLESLRVWHADAPVTVYALTTNWRDEHAARLEPFNVTIEPLEEDNERRRGGGIGRPIQPIWKIDALNKQTEPFLYLDADTLVLHPLDDLFAMIEADGWAAAHEVESVKHYHWGGFGMREFHWGELESLSEMDKPQPGIGAFNSGVIGCDPSRFADVLQLAGQWRARLEGRYHTDQALLNLAWYKLRQTEPPDAGLTYNSRFTRKNRFALHARILHLCGLGWGAHGKTKTDAQRNIWNHWPRGQRMTRLADTDFWQSTLPHPWEWPNQQNQYRHRAFIRDAREKSKSLRGVDWLVIDDSHQAYMIDRDVLREIDAFWQQHAGRLKGVPHEPTYHLHAGGVPAPLARQRRRRTLDDLIAMAPR